VQEVLLKGYDLHDFLVGLQEYVRNLLFSRIPGVLESESQNLQADITRELIELSRRFAEGDLIRMSEILRKADNELRWSAYPRFLIEITLLKMLYMDSTVSIEDILTQLKGGNAPCPASPRTPGTVKKKETPIASPAKPADNAAPVQAAAKSIQKPGADEIISVPPQGERAESFSVEEPAKPVDPDALWNNFIKSLMSDRPNLGAFLSMGHVAKAKENSIDLRFAPELSFQFAEVTRKAHRDIIQSKLTEFAGRAVDLHMSIETHKPKDTGAEAAPGAADVSPSLEDDMEQEPIIRNVIEIFDGEEI
jgi:DNA polymerase-3 subunit gamma/tau